MNVPIKLINNISFIVFCFKSLTFFRLAALEDYNFQQFLTEAETILLEHRLNSGGKRVLRDTVLETIRNARKALQNIYLTQEQKIFIPQLIQILDNIVNGGMSYCSNRKECKHFIKGIHIYHIHQYYT